MTMRATRNLSIGTAAAAILFTVACSKPGTPPPTFPPSVSFDGESLEKAAAWEKEGMSAISYSPPGEKPPLASLSVGVILSSRHLTALDLHSWVREQSGGSGDAVLYNSDGDEESCKVGGNPQRSYVALQVCKTGVARAVCVEADETIDPDVITTCVNQCLDTVCDRQWLERREALDLLAADMLTVR
jgi:hypothetical protein